MDCRRVVMLGAALFAGSALAQSIRDEAAYVLDQSPAYQRGFEQALDLQIKLANLREYEAQQQRLATQQHFRETLAAYWQLWGIPEAEAKSVAATYEIDADQEPLIIRGLSEGAEQLVSEAKAAYKRGEFRYANRLLIGAHVELKQRETGSSPYWNRVQSEQAQQARP